MLACLFGPVFNHQEAPSPRGFPDRQTEPVVAGKTRLRHYLHGVGVALETGREGEVGKGSTALRDLGNWGAIAGAAAIIFFAGTAPAQAYLDPGTGLTYVLQTTILIVIRSGRPDHAVARSSQCRIVGWKT